MNIQDQSFNQLLDPFPPVGTLSQKDEQRYARSSNPDSKAKIVNAYMREAFVYAHRCSYGKIKDCELLSVCYHALVESAKIFRPGKTRFFPYAKANIRGNIYEHWRSEEIVHHAPVVPLEHDVMEPECGRVKELTTDFEFDRIDMEERLVEIKEISKQKLSVQEAMVLELSYIGGYSFAFIGTMLKPKVTREAVRVAHWRAIQKIRAELEKKGHCFNNEAKQLIERRLLGAGQVKKDNRRVRIKHAKNPRA